MRWDVEIAPTAVSTLIHYGLAASLYPLCHRLHPAQNDVGDPGLRVVFPGAVHFRGPCAGRRLGRRRLGRRRGAERRFDVPFFGRSKKGTPGPVTARYVGHPHPGRPNAFHAHGSRAHAGRAHSGRLIGAFQRSTLRSGRASLAMEGDPSLSGIADVRSDLRVILGVSPGIRHPRPYP